MSDLIPCVDCGIGFSEEILRAHLAERHTIWTCEACGDVIRHSISGIEVEQVGSLQVLRLRVCSRKCISSLNALGACLRCKKPLTEGFAEGICPTCANRPVDLSEDEDGGDLPDSPPDERAAWLPRQYRRSGWRLDHAPFEEEEEAA